MYKDIIQFLDQRRLKEAFSQLYSLASEINDWELLSEVETLKTTYGYMLQYASQGMEDPERSKMYAQLHRKGYELADQAGFLKEQQTSQSFFSCQFRELKQHPSLAFNDINLTLESIVENLSIIPLTISDEQKKNTELKKLYEQNEKIIDELFDKIWSATLWNDDDKKEAETLINSQLIPSNALAVMTSAITLNLLKIFDAKKFQFLLQLYNERTEMVISQRALIGILLTAFYQEKRITLYPELIAELTLLTNNSKTIEQLHNIQILFLLSRETEKIDKKMREEIIPQMMRNPKLRKPDLKIIDIEDLEDKNPEWENFLSPEDTKFLDNIIWSMFEGAPVDPVAATTVNEYVYKIHDPRLVLCHYMYKHLSEFKFRFDYEAIIEDIVNALNAQTKPGFVMLGNIPVAYRTSKLIYLITIDEILDEFQQSNHLLTEFPNTTPWFNYPNVPERTQGFSNRMRTWATNQHRFFNPRRKINPWT